MLLCRKVTIASAIVGNPKRMQRGPLAQAVAMNQIHKRFHTSIYKNRPSGLVMSTDSTDNCHRAVSDGWDIGIAAALGSTGKEVEPSNGTYVVLLAHQMCQWR
jgi:hypothetical protein